jgi:hypothetical protein
MIHTGTIIMSGAELSPPYLFLCLLLVFNASISVFSRRSIVRGSAGRWLCPCRRFCVAEFEEEEVEECGSTGK